MGMDREEAEAFQELIKLSSHYATLLNQYDGGQRMTFSTVYEWMKRLREVRDTEDSSQPPS